MGKQQDKNKRFVFHRAFHYCSNGDFYMSYEQWESSVCGYFGLSPVESSEAFQLQNASKLLVSEFWSVDQH